MEALQLDPHTAQQYANLYKVADEDKDGQVGFQDALNFFSKSNLTKEALAQIWSQVNPQNLPVLGPQQFAYALQLIALAQSGRAPVIADLLALKQQGVAIPLPQFPLASQAGQPQQVNTPVKAAPPQLAVTVAPAPQPSPLKSTIGVAPNTGGFQWVVTPETLAGYHGHFVTLDHDKDGFIGGNEVLQFFATSQLPPATLAQIWELADQNKDGRVDSKEFSLAMFLASAIRNGIAIPSPLPQTLIQSIWGQQNPHQQHSAAPVPQQANVLQTQPQYQQSFQQPQQNVYVNQPQQPQSAYVAPQPPQSQPNVYVTQPAYQPPQPQQPAYQQQVVPQPAPVPQAPQNQGWALTQEERNTFGNAYATVDPQRLGFVDANVARSFLTQSGLPMSDLATVYSLADHDRDGRLSQVEFLIAMKLIRVRQTGVELPREVPADLLASVGIQQQQLVVVQQPQSSYLPVPQAQPQQLQPQVQPQLQPQVAPQVASVAPTVNVADLQRDLNQAINDKNSFEAKWKSTLADKATADQKVSDLEKQVKSLEEHLKQTEAKLIQAEARLNVTASSASAEAELKHKVAVKEQEVALLKAKVEELEKKAAEPKPAASAIKSPLEALLGSTGGTPPPPPPSAPQAKAPQAPSSPPPRNDPAPSALPKKANAGVASIASQVAQAALKTPPPPPGDVSTTPVAALPPPSQSPAAPTPAAAPAPAGQAGSAPVANPFYDASFAQPAPASAPASQPNANWMAFFQ